MIDASFLTALKAMTQPTIVPSGDKHYSTALLHNLPLPNEPGFPTVALVTLDSLIDYVAANKDKAEIVEAQILCGAQTVDLMSPPLGENRRRDILAKVACGRRDLKLNCYLDPETFRLQLLTQYTEDQNQRAVLSFVSKISDSNVVTADDDGVTQQVTAKIGVASHAQIDIPSPVLLAPIRTFEEVEQPLSSFVFRMQKSKSGGLPEAGLFEIDTNWQRKAAVSVAEYLKDKLPEMTVLA